jgi:putative protease
MCVSISGRCFLSALSFGQSANRGKCLQPCRREYLIKDVQEGSEYLLGKDYLLSPKDLCTIEFIDKLIEAGVDAFKIEGRKRSPEYIKTVVSVYRCAIDLYFVGKLNLAAKADLFSRLDRVYNRGFSTGFYFGQPKNALSRGLGHLYEKIYLGEVVKFYKKISVVEIRVDKEELIQGDELLFIGKETGSQTVIAQQIQQEHEFVKQVCRGQRVGIKIPFMVKPKDKVFLWRPKKYG